jgi:addiction module HigA family antidote
MSAGLPPTHPGAIWREDILPALKQSKAEIARLIKVSRQTLYDIINERQGITAPIALKLGQLLNTTPEFWLNMQQAYDVRIERERMQAELAGIPTLEAAA